MVAIDKPNILIVDDKPQNLLALEGVLSDMDLNIFKAESGNAALGAILKTEYALVLLDVQMPEMDGYEVAELMRGNKKTREIPIIFFTAISKEQSQVFKGYEAGAVDFIFKPIDPFILKSKVGVFIELYRQKRALKNANEQLKKSVDELEEANKKIVAQQESILEKERLTVLLQMAGATAHELNQPLTILQGNIDLLRLGADNMEQFELYLSRIEDAGDRVADIVRKIQNLRHDRTKPYLNSSIIDLHQEEG